MPPDLHFHIPLGFSGTMTVSNDGQVTVTSAASATLAAASSSWPGLDPEVVADLEEMLKRQKDYDPTTRSREIATTLFERGWHASVNLKGAYVLFKYAGKEHPVSLYLSSL